jgi:hypothetical protein
LVPTQITATITNLANIATVIAGAAVVLFIIMAGWQFMSAGGSSTGQKEAKQTLIYAAVGFAIVVLAQVLAQMLNTAIVH